MNNAEMQIYNEKIGIKKSALEAVPTGTVSTAVLRFTAGTPVIGPVPLSRFATLTTTATEGTILRLIERGNYKINLTLPLLSAAGTVIGGISVDGPASPIVLNPDIVAAHLLSTDRKTGAVAVSNSLFMSAILHVTQPMINAGLGLIRFLATNGSNLAPDPAVLSITEATFQVWRLDDQQGSG